MAGSTEASSAIEVLHAMLPAVPIGIWLVLGWLVGIFTPTLQKWVENTFLAGEKLECRAWIGQDSDASGEYHFCIFGKAVNVTDAPVVVEFATAQALGSRRLKLFGRRERHLIVHSGTEAIWPFPSKLERSDALELQYWLPLYKDNWESAVKMRIVFEDSRGREWATKWLSTSDIPGAKG